MKLATPRCWLLACAIGFITGGANASEVIPHLEQRDGMTKLIVDGRPFICVAGELANSSSTDVETMKLAWPRLAHMNLNTILTVVSWDLIEPQEGKYDFSMIDYQIQAARTNHLRLMHTFLDGPFVLIINTAPDEYYFATGGNFPFRVSTRIPGANIAAAATIDRGYFNNGKWILAHRLNGDDIMTTGDLSGAAAKHQSGSVIPPRLPRPMECPVCAGRRHVTHADHLARHVLPVSLIIRDAAPPGG